MLRFRELGTLEQGKYEERKEGKESEKCEVRRCFYGVLQSGSMLLPDRLLPGGAQPLRPWVDGLRIMVLPVSSALRLQRGHRPVRLVVP